MKRVEQYPLFHRSMKLRPQAALILQALNRSPRSRINELAQATGICRHCVRARLCELRNLGYAQRDINYYGRTFSPTDCEVPA